MLPRESGQQFRAFRLLRYERLLWASHFRGVVVHRQSFIVFRSQSSLASCVNRIINQNSPLISSRREYSYMRGGQCVWAGRGISDDASLPSACHRFIFPCFPPPLSPSVRLSNVVELHSAALRYRYTSGLHKIVLILVSKKTREDKVNGPIQKKMCSNARLVPLLQQQQNNIQ